MIAVSACLVGDNCTYKGRNKLIPEIKKLVEEQKAFKICPELLGGLSVPRERAEIVGKDGLHVIEGTAKVLSETGKDLTDAFIKGAKTSYEITKKLSIKLAVFKSNSPSCGCSKIYDGTFRGKLKKGDGVTTAFFKLKGIKVISEKEFK